MRRGDVRWVNDGRKDGERPVLVVQSDDFNDSLIPSVLCIGLSDDQRLAHAPGNVFLSAAATHLPAPVVANVADLQTIDRRSLSPPVGRIAGRLLREIDEGLRLVFAI